MSRKFHVEFDMETKNDGFTVGSVWATAQRGDGAFASTVVVPAAATITEILPPLEDGYYTWDGSNNLYRHKDGNWTSWRDAAFWPIYFAFDEIDRALLNYLGPIRNEKK